MNNKQKDFLENDLFYELRMLLGAANMVKLFDEKDMGNPASLFRDSVYLHARNLYNFFEGCARHDASIHDFTSRVFNLGLYKKWRTALHNHVLHINEKRLKENNTIEGVPIDAMVQEFAKDIEQLWGEWIEFEKDQEIKKLLLSELETALEQANDDYNNSAPRIKDKEDKE